MFQIPLYLNTLQCRNKDGYIQDIVKDSYELYMYVRGFSSVHHMIKNIICKFYGARLSPIR